MQDLAVRCGCTAAVLAIHETFSIGAAQIIQVQWLDTSGRILLEYTPLFANHKA
jgi:hypothetical protein